MTVRNIRKYLEAALNNLSDYQDDSKVVMVSNTYFLKGAYVFLGIAGYDGGYIDLDDIRIEEDEDEEY